MRIGLASRLTSTIESGAYIAGLLALIIITAFATVARTFGKTPPAPRNSDSNNHR